ncbi:MAG TPA: DR2241 family protein [Candidatus Udaeobacter sp.]|jgi:sirohydrochlorin cobaltochelatase
MQNLVERRLEGAPDAPFYFGQILVRNTGTGGFVLSHREDESLDQLEIFRDAEGAIEIAKCDDAGNYRPLKTAPNLRHGWRMQLATVEQLRRALDYFYPGRLAVFAAWKTGRLRTTPLRETLERQSGMYRVAAKISDAQINDVVAGFCRSNGGCVRTIVWKRDQNDAIASTKLPKEKFDPSYDQTAVCSRRPAGDARASQSEAATVPLLCQEACNLLVAECRKVVKGESATHGRGGT